MKAIIAGLAAVVVIVLVAGVGLPQAGFPTQENQSGGSVRLD